MTINVTCKKKRAKPPGEDDLDVILSKDKTIKVKGEDITFKEYGFYSGLLIRNAAKDFIKDLSTALLCEESEMLSKVDMAFENHAPIVVECVAMACGRSRAWVMGLDEHDGIAVDRAWWETCGSFFVRCAKRSLHSAKTLATDAGQTFGQSLSTTDIKPNI